MYEEVKSVSMIIITVNHHMLYLKLSKLLLTRVQELLILGHGVDLKGQLRWVQHLYNIYSVWSLWCVLCVPHSMHKFNAS